MLPTGLMMAGVVQQRYSMTEMHRSVAEAIAQINFGLNHASGDCLASFHAGLDAVTQKFVGFGCLD